MSKLTEGWDKLLSGGDDTKKSKPEAESAEDRARRKATVHHYSRMRARAQSGSGIVKKREPLDYDKYVREDKAYDKAYNQGRELELDDYDEPREVLGPEKQKAWAKWYKRQKANIERERVRQGKSVHP